MRSTSASVHRARLGRRVAAALILTDRALRLAARWGAPAALVFAVLSGPLLPLAGGGFAPYAGLRSLHVLAGEGVALAAAYRVLAWGMAGAGTLWRSARQRRRPRMPWPPRAMAGLEGLHGLLLALTLWSGIERYAGQRFGVAILPLLSAQEWGLAHRLVVPYYVAALLVLLSIKTRVAWRAVLDELRRP